MATALDMISSEADSPSEDISSEVDIPAGAEFGGRIYLPAPELARYAYSLQERRQMPLLPGNIDWYWKMVGSRKDRACAAGGQQVVSGLLEIRHGTATFIAWIAVDILAEELGADKLEAVVYHRLSHLGSHVKTGAPIILPHEFSGFATEVKTFGFWSGPLRSLAEHAKQLALPLDGPTLPPELDGRIWGPIREGD